MSIDRLFLFLGSVSALLAVAAGAFGAHALKATLTPQALAVFDTAVRYQMLHALALCVVAWAQGRFQSNRLASLSGALFVLGTVLFSGSLYLHSVAGLAGVTILAPFGGAAFIGGWVCLAWMAVGAPRRPT